MNATNPNREMTDYKNYSLNKLKDWIHDVLDCGDATPDEVFDTFREVVQESYDYHKSSLDRAKKFLNLINGTVQITATDPAGNLVSWESTNQEIYDDIMQKRGCCGALTNQKVQNDADLNDNKVSDNKWVVPVEEDSTGEQMITFPDDLIEKVGWKEGDSLNWKDNGDGSFTLTKV